MLRCIISRTRNPEEQSRYMIQASILGFRITSKYKGTNMLAVSVSLSLSLSLSPFSLLSTKNTLRLPLAQNLEHNDRIWGVTSHAATFKLLVDVFPY